MPDLGRNPYLDRIKLLKSHWDSECRYDWSEIGRFIRPYLGKFYEHEDDGERYNRGIERARFINNDAPGELSRRLAAALYAGLTSPARPWFKLVTADPVKMDNVEIKGFLHEVEQRVLQVFSTSNYYKEVSALFDDLVTFGTAAMFCNRDHERYIDFHTFTPGEYYLGLNSRLEVDTFAREFYMTPVQMVEEFGGENVSPDDLARTKRVGSLNDGVKIYHLIEPNDARYGGYLPDVKWPYRSVYFDAAALASGRMRFLRKSGFERFPVIAPRWRTRGSRVYGIECPGMIAIGDAKQLQTQEYLKQDGICRLIDPPLIATYELKNAGIDNMPGGVTFVDNPDLGMKPLTDRLIPIDQLLLDINATEERLSKTFMLDLVLAIQGNSRPQDMKATVAESVDAERLLLLGPILERLNSELFGPTIAAVIAVLSERKLLPDPPDGVESDIKIEYTSVLSQVQQSVALSGVERLMSFVGQLGQFNADALDIINFDSTVREAAQYLGVSPEILNTEEEIQQLRQARSQQQQLEGTLQAGEQSAKIASDLASAAGNPALNQAALTGLGSSGAL